MRASGFAVSAWLALAAVGPATAGSAYDRYVDLQLVLAVDVSGSMDPIEQRLQRDGYIAAFKDPEIIKAITSGPYGRIAVTYVQWAGSFFQQATVPWTIIGSQKDSLDFAEQLRRAPIYSERGTSISTALSFSGSAFSASNLESDRRTIDISGDGSNNDGPPVGGIRDRLVRDGVTINGLPILINPSGVPGNLFFGLDDYYRDCVKGGPGSFVISIKTLDQFAPAIRRKLILEIAGLPLPEAEIIQVQGATTAVNCALADRATINNFFP